MSSRSKKLGIVILVVLIILYIASQVSFEAIERTSIAAIKESNKMLMGQNVTIDDLYVSPYGDYSTIHELTIDNPSGYVSPLAFSTTEAKINTTMINNQAHIMVNSVRFKNVHLNYDKGLSGETNLYKIVSTLINNVNNTQNTPIKDEKFFFINKVTIEKPIIVVYDHQALIKTIHADDIVLRFDQLKQPTTYKMVLAYGCEQLIRAIDSIVNKK